MSVGDESREVSEPENSSEDGSVFPCNGTVVPVLGGSLGSLCNELSPLRDDSGSPCNNEPVEEILPVEGASSRHKRGPVLRFLCPKDVAEVKLLCAEWFPVE